MTTVISYYTESTPYEREAERLRKSLDRVGMSHVIEPAPDQGDWQRNIFYKPAFITAARHQMAGPILWIDVDAFVHENCEAYFEGLQINYDFAAHWFQGPSGGRDFTRNDNWFLSGTVWLNDTPAAMQLCRAWHDRTQTHPMEGAGQASLKWVIESVMVSPYDSPAEKKAAEGWDPVRVKRLPARYCYIFDKSGIVTPNEPIIIEHTIASRENKDESRGGVNQPRRDRNAELDLILEGGTDADQ